MNKTVTANIGGFVFNIEENAYETLKNYLETVRYYLGNEAGVDEIMHDIELRIAELFKNILIEERKEVINADNIQTIIHTMGKPEDYTNENTHNEKKNTSHTYEKQIYRDMDNGMIGGVCSGLSAYFGWDTLLLRIIFILLFLGFGTGILIYFVLWFIIPEAKTASEKLKMRGEKINIENIRQRFNTIRKDVENLTTEEHKKKFKTAAHQLADYIGSVLHGFFEVFGRVIGIALLLCAVIFIIYLIKLFINSSVMITINDAENFAYSYKELESIFFESNNQANLAFIGVALLCISVAVSLLSAGIRLLFKIKNKNRLIRILNSLLFSTSVIMISICAIKFGMDMSKEGGYTQELIINTKSETLYIKCNDDIHFSNHLKNRLENTFELIKTENQTIYFGYPEIEIRKSNQQNYEMYIEKSARASSQRKAINRAEKINYGYIQNDSLIELNPWFSTQKENLLRGQNVKIIFKVPEGKKIFLDKSTALLEIENYSNVGDEDEKQDDIRAGKSYRMSDKGLKE